MKRIMKRIVILVSGKKRSGKNFVSDLIKERLTSHGYSVDLYAYADPMKEILCKTFGINLETLDYLKNEQIPVNFERGVVGVSCGTMRTVLQNFGTEGMQSVFGKEVWKDCADKFINNSKADVVIITDFRFPTEMIEGSVLLKIRNDDVEDACKDTHISENLLKDFKFDFEIDNTGQSSESNLLAQIEDFYNSNIMCSV